MNCLLFCILEGVVFTLHGSLKNAEKESEWDIGKVYESMSKILMDFPVRREAFEKSLTVMFIHCHILVIDGAGMKIVCTVLLKYGQHSIRKTQNSLPKEMEETFWF